MNQNSYLKLLRQYAALARRLNRSFAEPVNAIVQARFDAISKQGLTGEAFSQAQTDLRDQAEREYGTVDRDFKVDFIPF